MKKILFILLILGLISCEKSGNKTRENGLMTDSSVTGDETLSDTVIQPRVKKLSVIVLPPFDEIANEGISPSVQNYIEREISKDTSLTLIKFPYKELMNVPYHNVFDKKYCKPITDRVDADIVIMTKLEQNKGTGQMTLDKWNLSIRIYNAKAGTQVNSSITGENLSGAEIAKLLALKRPDLIGEIENIR